MVKKFISFVNESTTNIKVIDYYRELNKYDNDYDKVGWHSGEDGQKNRFKILLDIGVKDGDSIVDFGCGLGDLYGYLRDNNFKVKYIGVDICDFLIKQAKEKYPKGKFVTINSLDDIQPNFDWFMASGVFTYGHKIKEVMNTLIKVYDMCNKGISFNMLEFVKEKDQVYSPVKYYDSKLNFFNSKWVLGFVKEKFGNGELIQGYDEILDAKKFGKYTDFTIYTKK
jgi:SAM-dependent methyltransferase